ncbi:MAG: radical SAM protein, partial [Acidobacteriaceae bacterium]|nr:radical SAM protein [Acidobacteriaceae bacterium]
MWQVRETTARSILSPVSGFLKEAGFTHSLTPARNCSYGCTYCYVPTMGIYGGLKPEDWKRWGQFTTLKTNAAELVARSVGPDQVIYCSPLVDPYQPAERFHPLMPGILGNLLRNPPRVFVVQTRGPLIVRDLALLADLAAVTQLRISFSVTTDRDDVRRRYEPHCESTEERLDAIRRLRAAGLQVYATLAPLLPSDPIRLARMCIEAAERTLIGDPLHVRQVKPRGATTRRVAFELARRYDEQEWFCPEYQRAVVDTIGRAARQLGYDFAVGP